METDNILAHSVAKRVNLPEYGVRAVIELLDDGATVPFISRYRKDRTGSLNEVDVRAIESALAAVRALEARKDFVRQAITDAGAMTDELSRRLDEADTMTAVEDIYAPFKPKRRTRATAAREKGLEPLAKMIMAGRTEPHKTAERFVKPGTVDSVDDALQGARDIIAEWASESARLRNAVRRALRRKAVIKCSTVKGQESALEESPFAGYAAFSTPLQRCSSHQYLAIRRAESQGLLKVKFVLPQDDNTVEAIADMFVSEKANSDCAKCITMAVEDAYKRLLLPAAETDISAELKEKADTVAIDIFADTLRQLLLAPPLLGKRVLAFDPGFRSGCKVAALDAQGNLLHDCVIYPHPPQKAAEESAATVSVIIRRCKPDVIAIGNGTASRETEAFIKNNELFDPAKVFIVSESGASVYSASELAANELPDKDITVRGTVSIGRRLIDPLAELIKIDPKSIGVGQYQHDVDQARLKDALDFTVLSCVNAIGVNLNTASERLLSYVSGIGPQLAANIVAYRAANGDFCSRAQLKKVKRLGDKAFEQSAGFLRITGGNNPLDNTGIHPESYALVETMAKRLGVKVGDMPANNELLDRLDPETLANEGIGGKETITDIIAELRKPGRDPRTDTDTEAFTPTVSDINELKVGMMVDGIVDNITAFGAFIDLGIKDKGLIHISQLSNRRVNSVGEVLKIHQKVHARVIDIDLKRHRISLSLKQ